MLISIGNSLRRDDSIAHIISETILDELNGWNYLQSIQLLPEIVESMTNYDKVVIFDAEIYKIPGLIKLKRLDKTSQDRFYNSHSIDIYHILDITDKKSDIYLLTITVNDTGFGEVISDELSYYLPSLRKSILNILSKI